MPEGISVEISEENFEEIPGEMLGESGVPE